VLSAFNFSWRFSIILATAPSTVSSTDIPQPLRSLLASYIRLRFANPIGDDGGRRCIPADFPDRGIELGKSRPI
jgi:hypothetical protein